MKRTKSNRSRKFQNKENPPFFSFFETYAPEVQHRVNVDYIHGALSARHDCGLRAWSGVGWRGVALGGVGWRGVAWSGGGAGPPRDGKVSSFSEPG